MKKDIKIQDLIQVWNYTSLSFNLFEVYDIYKSEYGGYIYECFKITMIDKTRLKRSTFTDYIHNSDVVGVFSPLEEFEYIGDDK